jgi:uncharacterized protein YkwD
VPRSPRHGSSRHALPLLVGLACGGLLIGTVTVGVPIVTGSGPGPGGPAAELAAATTAIPTPGAAPPVVATVPPPVVATAAPTSTPEPAPTTTVAPEPTPEPTTTRPAPTTTRDPAPRSDGPAAAVVDLVNRERAGAGCDPVTTDGRLAAAAQDHADDMAANGYFSHTSQDGRDFAQRIRAAGYPSPGAENIAAGQTSAESVMEAWMNSEGHRRNILDCSLTAIGVGHAPAGNYWVQNFGR